jgi:hypothetical protein
MVKFGPLILTTVGKVVPVWVREEALASRGHLDLVVATASSGRTMLKLQVCSQSQKQGRTTPSGHLVQNGPEDSRSKIQGGVDFEWILCL